MSQDSVAWFIKKNIRSKLYNSLHLSCQRDYLCQEQNLDICLHKETNHVAVPCKLRRWILKLIDQNTVTKYISANKTEEKKLIRFHWSQKLNIWYKNLVRWCEFPIKGYKENSEFWNWKEIPVFKSLDPLLSSSEISFRIEEGCILSISFLFRLDSMSYPSSLVRSLLDRFAEMIGFDGWRIACSGSDL